MGIQCKVGYLKKMMSSQGIPKARRWGIGLTTGTRILSECYVQYKLHYPTIRLCQTLKLSV